MSYVKVFSDTLSGCAERIWKNSCRTTVLEPGSSIFNFICRVCCSILSSGWRGWWKLLGVWKSWCKVTHYTNVALLIIISLPDRQTLWIQGIFFSVLLLLMITNIYPVECFGYDYHHSTGSSLIRFCPDCALRVPSSMGSTLDCIAFETWFCVCLINFHHLTSIDQPFQLHSHCPTCFGVQHDKCYWFHLCVRSSW